MYFDNVGGDILDLCLKNIAVGARIVCCGAISIYNLTSKPKGIINYFNLIKFRAKMEGFIVTDYQKKFPEAREQLLKWISQGKIKGTQTIVQG